MATFEAELPVTAWGIPSEFLQKEMTGKYEIETVSFIKNPETGKVTHKFKIVGDEDYENKVFKVDGKLLGKEKDGKLICKEKYTVEIKAGAIIK